MHRILSPEEISLDIEHFENQIREAEQNLASLRQTKAILEDAIVIYHLKHPEREAA